MEALREPGALRPDAAAVVSCTGSHPRRSIRIPWGGSDLVADAAERPGPPARTDTRSEGAA